jgi:hypothetical protein
VPTAAPGPAIERGTPPAGGVGAVALLFHGGKDTSHAPTKPTS